MFRTFNLILVFTAAKSWIIHYCCAHAGPLAAAVAEVLDRVGWTEQVQ